MRTQFVFVAIISCLGLTLAPACGDDGDDGGDPPDAAAAVDAATQGTDAATGEPSALGQTCTGMGQGNCPVGFECLALNIGGSSGTNPFCSKRCMDQNDPVCGEGYDGPGLPLCVYEVDSNGDNMPDFRACAVVCQDLVGGICQAGTTCDGSCPGSLQCIAALQNAMGTQVANACF